jgi:hypothetical protein
MAVRLADTLPRTVSNTMDHLKAGQLGTMDVTESTVANIGPGIDFYFAFGVIAVTAGIAAPLTILAAGVAVTLLALTAAEFTKACGHPTAGSPEAGRSVRRALQTGAASALQRLPLHRACPCSAGDRRGLRRRPPSSVDRGWRGTTFSV